MKRKPKTAPTAPKGRRCEAHGCESRIPDRENCAIFCARHWAQVPGAVQARIAQEHRPFVEKGRYLPLPLIEAIQEAKAAINEQRRQKDRRRKKKEEKEEEEQAPLASPQVPLFNEEQLGRLLSPEAQARAYLQRRAKRKEASPLSW